MLKRFISILTFLALVLGAIMPVQLFAGGDICYEGRICRDLGMLKGETGVVDEDYLETRPSRLQAAIMFLRLKGLEQDALHYTGGNNFKDAHAVAWKEGRNVLSYLKDHPGMGWIGDGVNFMPYSLIDSKAYYKVLLESLGYRQKIDGDGDFSWDSVLEFAENKGLYKVASAKVFTVESLAIATVEALKTKMKGTGKKLIEHLVNAGVIDRMEAISEGLYSKGLEAKIKSVGAVSNSKVEVVFEESVDGSDAADEDLYEIRALEIRGVVVKNANSIIIDTSAMKENTDYKLIFNDKSYNFRGLKKDSDAPRLISLECKDTDLVELCFDRVLDNEAAQDTDSYSILGVEIKSAELDSTNTKIRLSTYGIQAGRSYELKIHNIKNGDGEKTKLITKRFTGKKDTTPPKLNKLTVLNNIKLLLEFSDSNGLNKTTAQDESNYRITYSGGSLQIESAIVKDRDNDGLWDSVELITESQEPGRAYTLIAANISDDSVLGNIITRDIKREFRGKAMDRTAPTIARNPQAVTNTMVEIEFKDANALDVQSACDFDNYEIDEDLEIKEIRIKNPDDLYSAKGRTVVLITSEMEKSESYTLTIRDVADEFGNEMKVSGHKTYRFKGLAADRTPPYITFVECIDSRTIDIRFDNIVDEESAENTANYRIDGLALTTEAVLQGDDRTVRLTVSSLASSKSHTILLNNIKDLSGNALSNVKVSVLYSGSLYDNDPPEVEYIEAVNEEEVWIHFDKEVYAKNAKMKTSGPDFEQVGSVLDDGTVVVMKASKPMKNEEYEVIRLTGIWDLRDNAYEFDRNLDFYGTDIENDPPEVEDWEQVDIRRFRVVFTEPVLLKGNGVSGIKNPGNVSIEWNAVLNPDEEENNEAYSTIDYEASKNIPADKEFRFNFTAMVSDYIGLGVYDEDDDYGNSGSTTLESFIEDDERPYIEYIEAITRNKIQIVFSEAMGLPGSYKITYDDDRGKLRTIAIDRVEIDSKDRTRVNIFTKDQMSDEYIYTLMPQSAAADIAGNKLDIKDSEVDFEGSNIMSSDYIQGVEILDAYTLKVSKSSRIYKVNSLYELGTDGERVGEDIKDGNSIRISDNVHKLASKKPLLKGVRYKITVDGIEYKFYGIVPEIISPLSHSKEIISFRVKGIESNAKIDNNNNKIILTLPKGTNLKKLVPIIEVSPYADITPGSGVEQDFTGTVAYKVTAEDGSTRNYTINASLPQNSENYIISFKFEGIKVYETNISEGSKNTVFMKVPYYTNVEKLVPVLILSEDASVTPEAGAEMDFSEPVKFTVTAQNGEKRTYIVTVEKDQSPENFITHFSFPGISIKDSVEIDNESRIISVTVPYGTDLTGIKASFKCSAKAVVMIGDKEQESEETINDFSGDVIYTIIAENGSRAQYTVKVIVTVVKSSEMLIKEFGFVIPKASGVIDETAKSINVTVPFGTDVTKLAAVFKSSDNSIVMVNGILQESGVTINSFTEKVVYSVTAENGSTQNYDVIVTVAAGGRKGWPRLWPNPIHHNKDN